MKGQDKFGLRCYSVQSGSEHDEVLRDDDLVSQDNDPQEVLIRREEAAKSLWLGVFSDLTWCTPL